MVLPFCRAVLSLFLNACNELEEELTPADS
jgi:hypothetical protein